MNVDGAVAEEQVYWPEVPETVIDAAVDYSAELKDNEIAPVLWTPAL
jgi:hypothetical protein